MEDEAKQQSYERFYLDTLDGKNAFLEINWNRYAFEGDWIRIVIGEETTVVRRDDIETILLALTNDPSRYMRGKSRKVGVRYIPVPENEFRKYKAQKEYAKTH